MSITASIRAFEMWDALTTAIRSEAHGGGKLAALVDVQQSAQINRAAQGPCAAVQLVKCVPTEYGQRRQQVDVEFAIILAASSADSPDGTRPANLADAMTTLRPLLDAGDGTNGLIPILNNPATFGLSGNALQSRIGDMYPDWELRGGAGQSVWAYFMQMYSATVIVSF